jgi:hypothetical protein
MRKAAVLISMMCCLGACGTASPNTEQEPQADSSSSVAESPIEEVSPDTTTREGSDGVPATWIPAGTLRIDSARRADDDSVMIGFIGSDPAAIEGDPCWTGYAATSVLDGTTLAVTLSTYRSSLSTEAGACFLVGYQRTLVVDSQAPTPADANVVDGASGNPIALIDISPITFTSLPPGWTLASERGGFGSWTWTLTEGGSRSVSITVSPAIPFPESDPMRGESIGTTTIQNRGAAWVHFFDGLVEPVAVLVLGDDTWQLRAYRAGDVPDQILIDIVAAMTPLPILEGAPAPTILGRLVGGVSDVFGQQAAVDVTGWLYRSADGRLLMCDELVGDPVTCSEPALEVDESSPWTAPPMIRRGSVDVSESPVMISGSVKYEYLGPGAL